MGRASGDIAFQGLVILVMVAVLAITLVCLLAAGWLMRLLGMTGMNVISRVSGMVVAALAVQFIIDGILAVLVEAQA
jgi:multiple antibiotic resistance protein